MARKNVEARFRGVSLLWCSASPGAPETTPVSHLIFLIKFHKVLKQSVRWMTAAKANTI